MWASSIRGNLPMIFSHLCLFFSSRRSFGPFNSVWPFVDFLLLNRKLYFIILPQQDGGEWSLAWKHFFISVLLKIYAPNVHQCSLQCTVSRERREAFIVASDSECDTKCAENLLYFLHYDVARRNFYFREKTNQMNSMKIDPNKKWSERELIIRKKQPNSLNRIKHPHGIFSLILN